MKNKSCFKELLYILLMLMMLSLSLTACGDKDSDDDKERKERKEKSVDDDEEDEDEEEESSDEDEEKEDDPEETPEPTPEPAEEPKKWRYAYSDYFEEYGPVLKENVSVSAESDFEGIDLTMSYAYNEKVKGMMVIIDDKLYELYGTLDGLYCQCELDGEWIQVYSPASVDELEEYGNIFLAEILLDQISNVSYKRYLKEVEEDGIIYDVIKGMAQNSSKDSRCDVECYINRETQEIAKIDMMFENGDVLHCEFEYLTEKEITKSYKQIISTLTKNGEEVDINEMKEIYKDYVDYVSIGGGSNDSDVSEQVKEENWDTYYESYFNEAVIFPDSYGLEYDFNMEGLSFGVRIIKVNGETWLRYSFGECNIDAYFDDTLLLVGSLDLDSDWALAYLDSADEVDDIFNMDFWGEISGQTEKLNYIDYMGAEEINGTIYDVVKVEFADDTTGQAYINREKQTIYKFGLETEGIGVEYIFEGYAPIKIPYEATEAKEMTVDEIAVYFEEILEAAMMEAYMY